MQLGLSAGLSSAENRRCQASDRPQEETFVKGTSCCDQLLDPGRGASSNSQVLVGLREIDHDQRVLRLCGQRSPSHLLTIAVIASRIFDLVQLRL